MAEISFSCPGCGRSYEVEERLAGKKARCKDCQEVMRIPQAAASAPAKVAAGPLTFPCPRCGHVFSLEAKLAGKKARCKDCGEVFRVPEGTPAAARNGGPPLAPPAPRPSLRPPTPEEDASGYDLGEPLFEALTPPPRPRSAAAAGPDRSPQHPPRAGLAPTPQWEEDEDDAPSPLRRWLAYRATILALAAGAGLLIWAFSALLPRAWDAGQAMFGAGDESPNEPAGASADRSRSKDDPGLELPEIAPDRIPLVVQHKDALSGLNQAFSDMARGYAQMRNPAGFAAGQAAVAKASADLDAAARKGGSLPKLEPDERAVLGPFVDQALRPTLARAIRELRQLKSTPGIKGDFSKLEGALTQTSLEINKEYPSGTAAPAVLVTLNNLSHQSQQKVIEQRAGNLLDRVGNGGLGWDTAEGKTHLKVSPVLNARAFAEKIDFGKVTKIQGRRIEVDVTVPVEPEPAGSPSSTPSAAQPHEAGSAAEATPAPRPANGPSAAGASIRGFRWADQDGDKIGGMGDPGRPDGNKDQHLVVDFDLPEGAVIERLRVFGEGTTRWVTQENDRYWPLAVYQGDRAVAPTYTPRVGTFSGKHTFDLYGNTPGGDAGRDFRIEADVRVGDQVHTLTSTGHRL